MKSQSGYYHIMVRGNEKKDIFRDDHDKLRFIEIIKKVKQGNSFYLHAFCLMDNHLHMMISEGKEDVARIMKRITVSYVSYFNKKYRRVGHLFQDRFKSEVIEQDSYVLSLVRYIHKNPVKAGIVHNAADYKWSSHPGYIDEKSDFAEILDLDDILGLFSENRPEAIKRYEKYMTEEGDESFIEIELEKDVMEEETARELYEKLLLEGKGEKQRPENVIKEFRERTNLSIRRIAAITGLNKDKVNRILYS
jgi:REP element-mobilizing transposase RayT/DNA-binding transcriptional regulator YiaG